MGKYNVKMSCGHMQTVTLYGKDIERHKTIEYLEENGQCSECRKAEVKKANAIKEMRLHTGLTQQAFSQRLNIPRRTLEDWERGARACPQYVRNLIDYYLKHENLYRE